MNDLDTREWLLTNGLGGFASGTVCDAHTRTYHGLLVAAIAPPGQRTLLLSRIDAELIVSSQSVELSTNYWQGGVVEPQGYRLLQSFQRQPVPTWVWGTATWQLTRQILMPYGLLSHDPVQFRNRVFVHYHYQGQDDAVLNLRPLIVDRSFHHQQRAQPGLEFSQLVESHRALFQAMRPGSEGISWQLGWSQGTYHREGLWYRNYLYPEESRRGLFDGEDLYSPGCLTMMVRPGDRLTLEARVRRRDADRPFSPPTDDTVERAIADEADRLAQTFHLSPAPPAQPLSQSPSNPDQMWRQLLQAGDQFIAHRVSIQGPTVIAGYPWFDDWGRDTLIALPGLAIASHRYDLARGLLETLGKHCQDGLIPNTFPDAGERPLYNSIDAALWWIETLGLYLEASQDWEFLMSQYAIVRQIYMAFVAGTHYNVRVDAIDGLVTWDEPGCALTWMDAVVNGEPITPRQGKPIEISALWYSALCWAQDWATRLQQCTAPEQAAKFEKQAHRYQQQAEQVKASLQKFWNPQLGYFHDTIAPNDVPNLQIRPNAVIALSLRHCGFSAAQGQKVLHVARERLLTPVGLRSLDPADREYVGHYNGNQRQRDSAYHQGSVWSWLIGPFIRAWQRFYPEEPLPWSPDTLLDHWQRQACLGSISEIFDGDPPHAPQGAIAQAWSVAELIRHWPDLRDRLPS